MLKRFAYVGCFFMLLNVHVFQQSANYFIHLLFYRFHVYNASRNSDTVSI